MELNQGKILVVGSNRWHQSHWEELAFAFLKATNKPMKDGCGDCNECVNICPTKAFTGEPFRAEDPREIRYNAHKCDKYLSKMERISAPGVCGMCLYVCPYGRNKINNSQPELITT